MKVLLYLFLHVTLAYAKWGFIAGFSTKTLYQYQVIGRSFTSLNQVKNQWSGVIYKAFFEFEPTEEKGVWGRISSLEYLERHGELPTNWQTSYDDITGHYNKIPISEEPFQIILKDGLITSISVGNDTPDWELNLIRSVVSQLQVSPAGRSLLPSSLNALQRGQEPYAMYKVKEASITGHCEVLYDLRPLENLNNGGDPWIQLVKSRNFSNCDQLPVYHFGLPRAVSWEPGNNQMGDFLSRSEICKIVKGGLHSQIQTSETTSEVIVSPDVYNKQKGSVVSQMYLNLTGTVLKIPIDALVLLKMRSTSKKFVEVSLVSDYHKKILSDDLFSTPSSTSSSSSSSGSSSSSESLSQENWHESAPSLENAPITPHSICVAQQCTVKINQILLELTKPSKIQDQLENFVILTELVRNLNYKELKQRAYLAYESKTEWAFMRDAIAEAGTGPSLLVIKDLITENLSNEVPDHKMSGFDAIQVLSVQAEAARLPTSSYIEKFFELVKASEEQELFTFEELSLRPAAALAFSNLLRQSVVDQHGAHNRYPVHTYGPIALKHIKSVQEIYVPHFSKELRYSVTEGFQKKGNSKKIQLYIRVLGNIAYPTIVSVFEPYFEGKIKSTTHQRTLMVLSMDRLAEVYPELTQSVVFKIYHNQLESYQVRVAAFFILMKTNPPADMLQRIAFSLNTENSRNVRSAVKTSLESASRLQGKWNEERRRNAASAIHLLPSFVQGVQYSRQQVFDGILQGLLIGFEHDWSYIGSHDGLSPLAFMLQGGEFHNGLYDNSYKLMGMMSSNIDREDFLQDTKLKHRKYYDTYWDHMVEELNMTKERERQEFEGNILTKLTGIERFWTFDQTSAKLFRNLLSPGKTLSQFEQRTLQNEIVIAFPTALGLPFVYKSVQPTFMSMSGSHEFKNSAFVSNFDLNLTLVFDFEVRFSSQTQGRLAFVGFNNMSYIAGNDRTIDFRIPLKGEVHIDEKKSKANLKIDVEKFDEVFSYNVRPFTAVLETQSPFSMTKVSNFKVLSVRKPQVIDIRMDSPVLSELGVTMKGESQKKEKFEVFKNFVPLSHGYPIFEETIEPVDFKLSVRPYQVKSLELSASLKSYEKGEGSRTVEKPGFQHLFQNIFNNNSDEPLRAAEVTLKIHGAETKELSSAFLFPKKWSKNSKILAIFRSQELGQSWAINATFSTPEEPMYDFKKAKGNQLPGFITVDVYQTDEKTSEITHLAGGAAKMERTSERLDYVKNSPQGTQCFQEIKNGNLFHYGCRNATFHARLYDKYIIGMSYKGLEPTSQKEILKSLDSLRYVGYQYLNEVTPSMKTLHNGSGNTIWSTVAYSPDLKTVNISMSYDDDRKWFEFLQVPVPNVARSLAVLHPTESVVQRVGFAAFRQQYEPICSIDESQLKSFDNMKIEFEPKEHAWTILAMQDVHRRFHYMPSDKFYIALRKEAGRRSLKCSFDYTEVDLVATPDIMTIRVNKDRIELENGKHTFTQGLETKVEITKIDENTVRVSNEQLEIIHMPMRTIIKSNRRVPMTGLCGNPDQDVQEMLTPRRKIAKSPDDFIASWTLDSTIEIKETEKKSPFYSNIISEQDAGRANKFGRTKKTHYFDPSSPESRSLSTSVEEKMTAKPFHKRLMSVDYKNKHCFSLDVFPMCKQGMHALREEERTIEFVCIEKSPISAHWEKLVLRGARPDFRQKGKSQPLTVKVPLECSQ